MRKGVTKMYTPFPRKKTYGLAQSFAWADAMLCVDTCKALRWHLQSFALAHAMLCVRDRQKQASKSSVLYWIRERGGKTHHMGHCRPTYT